MGGYVSFYPERHGSFNSDAAKLVFTVVVEPQILADMVQATQQSPGGATLSIGIEGLEHGWEPDASHQIWTLKEGGKDKHPITTFGYSVERFWTSESAIRDEKDRKLSADLADSPDPEARKLAALSKAENRDPLTVLLKECRTLLLAILLVAVAAVVAANW
jgi:hypothetical protein